ncbi:MAG: hypothetical protein P8174_07800 [Gemmatimonadota bacterium]
MSSSLPRQPNVELLRKQAKMLLAAQRRGAPACCALFRRLHRFADRTDADILSSTVTLAEAQLALALHYGHPGWTAMLEEARAYPTGTEYSLAAVRARAEAPIPDYAGAGVPLAVVAALNHAGVDVGFMEFAAASGWAFSFGYRYDDESPAFMAVRGEPGKDGPTEMFAFLPECYGFAYDFALTSEAGGLWSFVNRHVDAGTPIMSEHMDGGLIVDYRVTRGRRQVFFDGAVTPGWIDVDGLQPYAVYAFTRARDPEPRAEILRKALRRAAGKGRPHDWRGVPQGLAALRQYLGDVQDAGKDFALCPDWLGWAAFERLMARRCAEVWLRSVADTLAGKAGRLLAAAAGRYGEAFAHYGRYLAALRDGPPDGADGQPLTPANRIANAAPHLARGVAREAEGLDALAEAAAGSGALA